jgi:L-fucose isomerase-like protein
VKQNKVKIGFIPANRGFFSARLAAKMRVETLRALKSLGVEVVVPSEKDTRVGCVGTLDEAVKVGRMFREAGLDGILVSAVNFGDEQAVALAIKESALKVPVLIAGCQEEGPLTPTMERRDSFCGLLSIGEALRQTGVAYSVPETPVGLPTDESFRGTVGRFADVCRVVGGIRKARYGQVGARPDAFWTCRYNEKALQELGVTVVTLDLSEVFGAVQRMKTDADVKNVMRSIRRNIDCSAIDNRFIEKIAKFELVLSHFVEDKHLDGMAVQCWTSIQVNLGMCACSTMSRFDDRGVPCACEADILGTLSMHALQLASGEPSCLADWNNLHNEDSELVNCWHCGVFPSSWAKDGKAKLGYQKVLAQDVGAENAMGVVEFVMKDGPVTLCRATQDNAGAPKVVLAQGVVEPNKAETFGSYGWVRVPGLQKLYKNVLLRHFPHHVGMSRSTVGNVLWEAFGNYLRFQTYTANHTTGVWNPDLPFQLD